MGRGGKLSTEICIERDGEEIPYLLIDQDGKVTWLVSEKQQKEFEQKMLGNIGDSMSRFYTANPEYLKEENQDEENKQ